MLSESARSMAVTQAGFSRSPGKNVRLAGISSGAHTYAPRPNANLKSDGSTSRQQLGTKIRYNPGKGSQ